MNDDPAARLGLLLTGTEAGKLAARFEDGGTLSQALQSIALARRPEVKAALEAAGATPSNVAVAVPVLRAIQGANSRATQVSPVWTPVSYTHLDVYKRQHHARPEPTSC